MDKNKIYALFVNRVPEIRSRYHAFRRKDRSRIMAWKYLLWLNFSYYVLRNRELREPVSFDLDKGKKLCTRGSESSLSKRESPAELAESLKAYDVICFDVFDTLLLRPFDRPQGVFYLLEMELGYMDFPRIRTEIEEMAREKKKKETGKEEVTFEEIWELMEEETGIPKELGEETEWEAEKRSCFGNPYFLETIKLLKEQGKSMAVISDMYLRKKQIQELLQLCGYPEFSRYFVSCEYQASKNSGELFELVRKEYPEGRTFAHIGDNRVSDGKMARAKGFEPYLYRNVNEAGLPFRAEDMSVFLGSLYRGVVNAHLHNGLSSYSPEYELGFVYGGLFAAGYCRFIHDFARKKDIEKLLFFSRDGEILRKAYKELYPEERDLCVYAYWSRAAGTKLGAKYFKYDYFRRFLYHKVNQGYTLKQIFSSMDLEGLLETFLEENGKYTENTLFTDKNVENVKEYLKRQWKEVLAQYENQQEGAKNYYTALLKGCKRAAAVDIGWAGSGAILLSYLTERVWKLDCEIYGIVAGTNSAHSSEPHMSEGAFLKGRLVSYLFSERDNRDLWKYHNPGKGDNLYWETLLASSKGSLKSFGTEKGKPWVCRFREEEAGKAEEIQKGILDFICKFASVYRKAGIREGISGRDAYAPMKLCQQEENRGFWEQIEGVLTDADVN